MALDELLRKALEPKRDPTLDMAHAPPAVEAGEYTLNDISMSAVAAVQQWAETDDLDDGEGYADRLMAHIVGIADADKNGDIEEDEQSVLEVALNAAFNYLIDLGADEGDVSRLLNDWDEDAAERISELVSSTAMDDVSGETLDSAVFGGAVALDAVYKKMFVVRDGQKTRINKRISGTVKLTPKQKLAIKKARKKSHSAAAMKRRMKSMKVRRKLNL